MATSVNIGGGDDQFNRYKMPSVMGKVEGRGNGIKTRIVNCFEVARALHRPPGYVCKFFGCELGAQTKINDDEGVYIVNGSFNQAKLSEILQLFIRMFVLCGKCNLPETDLKLKKNGDIKQKKKSSSKKGDKADRRLRKNAKAGAGAAAEDKASARKTAKNTVEEPTLLPMGADVDFAAEADAAADAVHGNGAPPSFSMMVAPGDADYDGGDDDDGVEWSVDTSKEAQEARMRDLGVNMTVMDRTDKEEET
eukprot:IDg9242t1